MVKPDDAQTQARQWVTKCINDNTHLGTVDWGSGPGNSQIVIRIKGAKDPHTKNDIVLETAEVMLRTAGVTVSPISKAGNHGFIVSHSELGTLRSKYPDHSVAKTL